MIIYLAGLLILSIGSHSHHMGLMQTLMLRLYDGPLLTVLFSHMMAHFQVSEFFSHM